MYDFSVVGDYLDYLHHGLGVPCCDVSVYYHQKEVYRYMTGVSDHEGKRPIDHNTMFYLYSCTKPITVTAGLTLVEQKRIVLDRPAMEYLPCIENAYVLKDGEKILVGEKITVRNLFTMTGGLDYNLRRGPVQSFLQEHPDADTRQVVAKFFDDPLPQVPGQAFRYSLCHDVLGAVIEEVSGMSLGAYMKQTIFDPIGMTHTAFGCKNQLPEQLAAQYLFWRKYGMDYTMKNEYIFSDNYHSGGAGLLSTTDDYMLFADMLSNWGTARNGQKILSKETVELMRTPQLSLVAEEQDFSCAAGPGYTYALGVRVRNDNRGFDGEFGWDGADGSYLMADPEHRLAIVYCQQVQNWPDLCGTMHPAIRDNVYRALGILPETHTPQDASGTAGKDKETSWQR